MADAAQVRALAAYKDFLTLWKDANLDIPVLKQAGRSTRGCNSQKKSCLVTYCFPIVYVMRFHSLRNWPGFPIGSNQTRLDRRAHTPPVHEVRDAFRTAVRER
jgi:hypothetical protein